MELKENTTIVVLGASGDLAKKKTVGNSPQQCSTTPDANMAMTVPCALWSRESHKYLMPLGSG